MERRAAAVEETRRRILEATMDLHAEQGITGTTLQDIARRADVALGTVYRHFPSIDEVVTACGEATLAQMALPGREEIRAAFRGARSKRERGERLARQAAAIYRDGLPVFLEVRRSMHAFEHVAQAHRTLEAVIDDCVAEALAPLRVGGRTARTVRGLVDARTWDALRDRGLGHDEAAEELGRLLGLAL